MRFLRADIYGFGKWVDKTFDFSNGFLTCLYGENEAGKSTLQQFILYMMFGLSPRKQKLHQPKNSNRLGGALTIEDEAIGVYTIERVENRVVCLLPGGKTEDGNWLKERLNGMTHEAYSSIYAFSANDLLEIRRMKQDQLSDVLFSVGLSGATAIYRAEKKLDDKVASLFKKAGRVPAMNKQIKLVREKHDELLAYKKNEATYRDKIEQKGKLEAAIETRKRQMEAHQTEHQKHEKLRHMIPLLSEYRAIAAKLGQYPETIRFPEDGVNRYQTLKNNVIPLKSEQTVLSDAKEEYEEQLHRLKNELYAPSTYERAQLILKERQGNQTNEHHVDEKQKQLNQLDILLQEELLALDMEEKELQDISFPFHIEATWKEISETNVQLQQEGERLAEEHAISSEEMTRLQEAKKRHELKLLPDEKLIETRRKINEDDAIQAASKNREQQNHRFDMWKKKQGRLANFTLIGTLIMAVLSFILATSTGNNLLFGVAGLLLAVGLAHFFLARKTAAETEKSMKETPLLSPITKKEKYELERVIAEQEELLNNIKWIEKEMRQLESKKVQWLEKKRLFDSKESKWLDRLKTEQFTHPFLKKADPSHWVELLHKMKKAKQLLREKNEVRTELDELIKKQNDFQRKVETFGHDIGWKDEPITLNDIEDIMETYRLNVQSIKDYERLLEENEGKQSELKTKIDSFNHEINALFDVANVREEEEYFQQARELKEKEELTERASELNRQIKSLHQGMTDDEMAKPLAEDELDEKIASLKGEIEDCQVEISDFQKQLAAVDMEIEQMESADSNSEAALIYQVEREKLNALAKEWAISQTALTALKQAKDKYQEKYLAGVIRVASAYFSKLTAGRYREIFPPEAKELFQVEASNFMRYTVEELSQGTIDQLYVSLRLAISKVMSDKLVVPMMIDDAFVNFDNRRTAQMIDIIEQFAETQQILFFTCKKDVATRLGAVHIAQGINV